MNSGKLSFGPPGQMTKGKVARGYVCTRASGLSAGLQNRQSLRPKNDAETVCCVCLEAYSWEDQRIFTRCCEMAIGSYCKAQHIADFGECWNCGKEEIQTQAVPEAGSWVPSDPKDFEKEEPSPPLYVALPDAGREPETVKLKAGSVLPTIGGQGSNNPSSDTRVSETSKSSQPVSYNREAAVHQSQSRKEWSKMAGATPQSSPNLVNGHAKSYSATDKPNTTTPPESHRFLYNGSESSSSAFSQNDHQHVRCLTSRTLTQPDAKEYVIEATNHLVEMCDAYVDEINNKVMNEMLEILQGCKVFKAAIEQQTFESASAPTSHQEIIQSPASIDVSNLKSSERESYCITCEELESRMKKAADALLGV